VGWTFFYMFVILKIPIVAAFVLIWYAARPPDEDQGEDSDEGGGDDGHGRPPRRPRPPRRGPHPAVPPRSPRRVRARTRPTVPAAGRHA
jgi:hypothetical protein